MPDDDEMNLLLRVMVMLMLADGVIKEEEIATIGRIYHQVMNHQLHADEIRLEIAAAEKEADSLGPYLKEIGPDLDSDVKELIVQAAYLVAGADGEIVEVEQLMVIGLGEAFGMGEAELRQSITDLDLPPKNSGG